MYYICQKTLYELILSLQDYWENNGCVVIQPVDIEVGAGTSHPMTFFRAIGPEPVAAAYVQLSRRPNDGRQCSNSNKLQKFYQFQVIIKPVPQNFQELYLMSLKTIGLNIMENDVRFIEDNWQNPTLGAWGVGWEIRWNGMEITQFTYFQQMGGLDCQPITGEITYGLERLAMILQDVNSVFDIVWGRSKFGQVSYGDLFSYSEEEQIMYNFKYSQINLLFDLFEMYEKEAKKLMKLTKPLFIPAYENILKAMHIFNLLNARKVIAVVERQSYILRIYSIVKLVAISYYEYRSSLKFPMCNIMLN